MIDETLFYDWPVTDSVTRWLLHATRSYDFYTF